MKKLLAIVSLASLSVPGLSFAAYNDVSLSTETALNVNSITVNLSGSSATIESLAVGASTFSVTIEQGSFFEVTAPNLNQLSANTTVGQIENTCNGTESVMSYNLTNSNDEVTVTITPSSTLCSGSATSTPASSRSDERISGGGGSPTAVTVPGVVAETPAATVTATNSYRVTLTTNLSSGSRGESVRDLQRFLNSHGFTIATTGPGSPGKETVMYGNLTVKAVQKFQEKYNIAKPGVPGYGRVGPKTRAKINELSGQ